MYPIMLSKFYLDVLSELAVSVPFFKFLSIYHLANNIMPLGFVSIIVYDRFSPYIKSY